MLNLIMAHAKYSKLNVNGDGLMTIKYLFTNRCNIHHYKWRISLTIRGKVLSNPALWIQRVLLLALRVRGKEFKVLYCSFFFMLFTRFLKNVSTQRHSGDFSPTFMYVLFLYVIFVQLCFKLPQRVPENMQFHLFAHKPRAVIQLLW